MSCCTSFCRMRAVELPCCEAASIESVAPQSLGSMAPVLPRGASAKVFRPHGMFDVLLGRCGGNQDFGGGERVRGSPGPTHPSTACNLGSSFTARGSNVYCHHLRLFFLTAFPSYTARWEPIPYPVSVLCLLKSLPGVLPPPLNRIVDGALHDGCAWPWRMTDCPPCRLIWKLSSRKLPLLPSSTSQPKPPPFPPTPTSPPPPRTGFQ